MHDEVLQQLGLSKNEARIYETLLREGTSTVSHIALCSHVHRRNVYDALRRLLDRGLAYEVLENREATYCAAEPEGLFTLLEEKEQLLSEHLPNLERVYSRGSRRSRTCIYRGAEGWKNYMRDMLRAGGEAVFIGAKGAWLDERVQHFYPYFAREAKKKKIRFRHVFDWEIKETFPEILKHVGPHYRFLPREYSTESAVDIVRDQVTIIPSLGIGRLADEIRLIVIQDESVAAAFRLWFEVLWAGCASEQEVKKERKRQVVV